MESGQLQANAGQNDKALADYTAAIEQRPDMSVVWLTRGQFYMRFFCWDEAAADFAKGFELQPPADPNLWLSQAQLRLYVGDQDGYRRACAGMLDKFGQTTDQATVAAITQACTAGPDAFDDFTRVIRLVEKAGVDPAAAKVAFSPPRQAGTLGEEVEHAILSTPDAYSSQLLSLDYRAGNAEQALRLYEHGGKPGDNGSLDAARLAMAYHRTGQEDRARNQLTELNQGFDKQLASLPAQVLDRRTRPKCRCPLTTWAPICFIARPSRKSKVRRLRSIRCTGSCAAAAAPPWGSGTKPRPASARAIALRPKDVQPRLEHSRLLAKQRRWEEAVSDLDEVLRQHSDDGNVWLERGRLYAQEARWDLAAADFSQALEQPNFSDLNELGTPLFVEMLEPDAAFAALSRLRPRNAHLWEQRALVLDQKGKEADALSAYTKALEARPNDLVLLNDRAYFYGGHERWDAAAADYAKALELLPASPEHGPLGPRIYQMLQTWDHALDKTLALRPTDGQLHAVRARRRIADHEWDKARAAFAEAIKLLPDDLDLRRERGTFFARVGRWKEAAVDFDRIVDERPLGEDWFQDACLRRLSGDADGCRKLCAKWRRRYGKTTDANDASVAGRIAVLAPGAAVDPGLAVRLENRSVASQSTNAYTLYALGLAHYRAGHFEAAVHWYRESLKVTGNAATPNAHNLDPGVVPSGALVSGNAATLNALGLALAYQGLKQPNEAKQWLDQATAWLKLFYDGDPPKEEAEFAPPLMPLSDWLEYLILP